MRFNKFMEIIREDFMDNKGLWEKSILSVMGAWVSNKLGLLLPALGLLMVLMIIDYISGMLAAKKEAFENPALEREAYVGIYKKVGYMLTILVAISIDYLIFKFAEEIGLDFGSNTIFGLLVTVWFIINELISILENVGRMGAELPDFLKKALSELKNSIEDKEL